MRAGRMGFSFIRKTVSTGSSATGALVAANSLQPEFCFAKWVVIICKPNPKRSHSSSHHEFWCFHTVCDLVPGFLSIFPNFHAHDVPRESHEVIPCGHFVGF